MLADWDARLLAPERALRLVADEPVYATCERAELSQFEAEGGGEVQPDQWQINLRHGPCGQSVAMLGYSTTGHVIGGAMTSNGDLLSAVLRHMVMAHDLPLSGATL